MSIVLDELDKRLLHQLCTGIYSYRDLAESLGFARGTIYRRIRRLEKSHVINRKVMAVPDFARLNLSAICVGIDVPYEEIENVIELVRMESDVKFLWRTYGEYQVLAVLVCEKGCEGDTIVKLRQALSKTKAGNFHISIGFGWEKMDFTPY